MSDGDNHTKKEHPEKMQEMFNDMMLEFMRASLASAQQVQNNNQISSPTPTDTNVSIDTKLPLPKAYSGERDVSTIETFISKVEKLRSVKNWSQETTYTIACTLLEGRAANWINYLEKTPETAPTTWAELRVILEDKFKPANSEDLARDLLWNTVQQTTIQNYVDTFMDVSILVPDIGDKDLVDRFIHGLNDKELIAKLKSIPIAERDLETVLQAFLAHEAAHNPSVAQSTFNRITAAQTTPNDPMDLDAIAYRKSSSYNNRSSGYSGRGGYGNRGGGYNGSGGYSNSRGGFNKQGGNVVFGHTSLYKSN
jgi:hypothetical protein